MAEFKKEARDSRLSLTSNGLRARMALRESESMGTAAAAAAVVAEAKAVAGAVVVVVPAVRRFHS